MEELSEAEAISQDSKPGKYLSISVTDDGCGIPDDIIDKVTEPFFSAKALHSGFGLGMSTVARLVDAMHGLLEIDSEPNAGTTITFQIPAGEPLVPRAEA